MNESDLPSFNIPEPDLIKTIQSLEKEARELRRENKELKSHNNKLEDKIRVIKKILEKLRDI